MSRPLISFLILLAMSVGVPDSRGEGQPRDKPAGATGRVYGEWKIRVKPDQGPAYDRLIHQSGLPLFRLAGGRMVGWWKTLIGDLYEHVTIWEYDDMAAFERAGQILGKNEDFAKFVAARDPLLAGEESRFLRLAPGVPAPQQAEPAPFVIHETHRVPLSRREPYLDYMLQQGVKLLQAHGFRPEGPWISEVGRWSEITYLFRYNSLAEREQLIARLGNHPDGRAYDEKLAEYVTDVTTRLLIPAPFARPQLKTEPDAKPAASALPLPHHEQLTPGVHVAGFSDRHRSANCGWITLESETLLVDLPRGMGAKEFLALVKDSRGKPARTLALTNFQQGDGALVKDLVQGGIGRLICSPATGRRLVEPSTGIDPKLVTAVVDRMDVGDAGLTVEFQSLDDVVDQGGGCVRVPGRSILFGGPLIVNGPRTALAGSNTARWVEVLREWARTAPARVVPGFGSWGDGGLIDRQLRFLAELRRQVAYHVAQGRPLATLKEVVQIPTSELVWMPYDTPSVEDLAHVFREMTVPLAPFHGHPPNIADSRPHALVLIGDQPHEPGHLEDGLRPVFEATGIVPHFTVDVRALSGENLARVRLLVILRDGLQRPGTSDRENLIWMTPEQQRLVATFVEEGGGFLNLHNAMGLYPDHGPYLDLVGGRYIGHGPMERFRVEIVDPDHPVTRGVGPFFVADEQHTPPYDAGRVHLLLRNRSDEGKAAAAGWVREPGRGRLCHLANGHTREALLHPMFQKLMSNAMLWCIRHELSRHTIAGQA